MSDVIYYFRSRSDDLTAAWERHFAGIERVVPATGDIFGVSVDAVISPANCFGIMDGGIDLLYSKKLGWHVQDQLREIIRQDWDGELPVGLALMVETKATDIPFLVSAPTMRAPVNVAKTLNSYLAFRAALRVVQRHNQKWPDSIRSVACPGLATGTGEMPPEICAKQMRAAWDEVEGGQPFYPIDVNEALLQHFRLIRDE